MIVKIPPDEIITAVRSAAHEVFSTMLHLPLEDLGAFQPPEAEPPGTLKSSEVLERQMQHGRKDFVRR